VENPNCGIGVKALKQYLHKHDGETCLIVGNGPSLNNVPDDFLWKYISFGTNWCFLHDTWIPDYYVAVDPLVVRLRYFNSINQMHSVKFIGNKIIQKYRNQFIGQVEVIDTNGTQSNPGFCLDPVLTEFWEGWSVTYVALNLAYLMGFTTVLMVGVDHRYFEGEINHFDSRYEDGIVWQPHDMTKALTAYDFAKRAYLDANRRVYNLTQESALQVFPYSKLEDWA